MEKDIFAELTDGEEAQPEDRTCQAKTQEGESCSNRAVWPPDDPRFCHLPAHQPDEEEIPEGQLEEKEEPEKYPEDELNSRHIFSSSRASHSVFVTYPEPEGGFFIAEFEGGAYETNDDRKAKLLEEHVEERPSLKRVIEKLK